MEDIYQKIKELRIKNNITLKQLSEKTDLSVSFLSQIERGTSSLAINSLKKIADAFDVNITYFFEGPKNEKYVTKKQDQVPYQIKGLESKYVRLNGEFPARSLAPFLIHLAPNQKRTQTFHHPGEEFYYVLKGAVVFTVDNQDLFIKEGDSIHFPSELPHYGENPLEEETILLCVITPVIF
ncbi:XRE family transcriptional regulator [Bacillus haimaensis]|uniref:helix-turn-helix domain-containing protein n=1 Tax=Bacillus haimaensis TaxID=3160967 RepID=UPI003AA9AAD6